MTERLTDVQLEDLDDLARMGGIVGPVDSMLVAALLAEVRERREQDGAAKLVCEGYTAAHRERDVLRARVAELETALRECVDEDHGLLRLGGDIEKSSGEGVDWDHVAIGAADGILTRARAALAKGEK